MKLGLGLYRDLLTDDNFRLPVAPKRTSTKSEPHCIDLA
jgi:hypothetical protein